MPENSSDQENFADLFNHNTVTGKSLSPGQKITATVVDISQDSIFLDVGEKSEGFLDRKELEDETGTVTVKPGDTLEVYFLSAAHHEMLFTTKIGGGSTSLAHLEEAYRSSIPLEGLVKKEIKGGYEIAVAGNVRAFCPYSQMDLKRTAAPEEYIGQHLLFKIAQFEENGRNIVLSRRSILEEERELKRQELREKLQEGMTVTGKITSIKDFGAFVDVDGIEGLIPISEIGWSRIDNIEDILAVGQDVEVVILKLDWENDRFSFSLKQTLPDPWQNIARQFPIGSFQAGKVVRLAKFGAFVNLAPGIDGLIHISKLGGGRRINHPKEVVEEGQSVDVKIEEIDQVQKRISLSLEQEAAEDVPTGKEEEDVRQYLRKPEKPGTGASLGTLGEILKARLQEKEKK
jgi:small subunit ribosomal protein S1